MNEITPASLLPGVESLDFRLPPELEAGEPPEERGLPRDGVRLMVSLIGENRVVHARFHDLPEFLSAGDVLVINTSGTRKAALGVTRDDGTPLELHLSTRLPAELWVIELRQPVRAGGLPFYEAAAGEKFDLPGGGQARLLVPYRPDQRQGIGERAPGESAGFPAVRLAVPLGGVPSGFQEGVPSGFQEGVPSGFQEGVPSGFQEGVRLWIASLSLPSPLEAYLDRYGFPIRYKYVRDGWPVDYYQTVYASEMGSAEMPSAGRAFTCSLLDELERGGVRIVPLVLHTGVASLESHEPPYEEVYRVPAETAQAVNEAHAAGKRVIAVGTTVVRALETVSAEDGSVHPGEGWTALVITPQRGIRAVDGLLTGLHEPRSTHLAMLQALAGQEHLRLAYAEALRLGYLWHEFGDLHLILP